MCEKIAKDIGFQDTRIGIYGDSSVRTAETAMSLGPEDVRLDGSRESDARLRLGDDISARGTGDTAADERVDGLRLVLVEHERDETVRVTNVADTADVGSPEREIEIETQEIEAEPGLADGICPEDLERGESERQRLDLGSGLHLSREPKRRAGKGAGRESETGAGGIEAGDLINVHNFFLAQR